MDALLSRPQRSRQRVALVRATLHDGEQTLNGGRHRRRLPLQRLDSICCRRGKKTHLVIFVIVVFVMVTATIRLWFQRPQSSHSLAI